MNGARVDVVIAGAGPAGLFLAAELRRRGRSCIVLERSASPSVHSKALAIMPKTLRLFEHAGVAQAFLAEINRIRSVCFVTARSCARVDFERVRTPHPFVGILPQSRTERLLAEHARALGADLRYGHALEDFCGGGDGIELRAGSAAGSYTLRAAYLAGCDGARSLVRSRSGIAFDGATYGEGAVLADVEIETAIPLDEARVCVHASGMVTLFPIAGRLRRIVVVEPGAVLPESPDASWLGERAERAGLPLQICRQPLWTSAFRVHRRMAHVFSAGRVLLAGDAAHVYSPVGGQGMNAGLRDAFALAGALDEALAGESAALGRYARERRAEARRLLRRTDVLTRALVHPHPIMRVGREYLAPYVIDMPLLRDRVLRSLLTA